MLNQARLTTSGLDVTTPKEDWHDFTVNMAYMMLLEGSNALYGDELAYLNSILVSNGIDYC